MKKLKAAAAVFLVVTLVISCKKSDAELREKALHADQLLTEKSEINVEIKKLKDKLQNAPNDYEKSKIYSDISGLYNEKGDTVSTMKNAREAIKYQPNEYYPHYLLGKSYIDAGRYNEAEIELLTSVDLKKDYAPSHFELGNLYYKKMKYNNAINEYKATIKLDEASFQAYNNLGLLLNLTGRSKEAIDTLNQGIKVKPDFPLYYKNLGIIYDTVLKKSGDAVGNYKKYLELRPDCPERKSVEAWIKALEG